MLSKNKIKYIQSLQRKKNRDSENVFLIEGHKTVNEIASTSINIKLIVASQEYINNCTHINCEKIVTASNEIKKLSSLISPPEVIAICEKPNYDIDSINFKEELVLALDGVQDPGNLGTIIRLASWFGIETILCSIGTSDCYNPKALQATMGAIAHVKLHYIDLFELLSECKKTTIPIYGTFLQGDNIYKRQLSSSGIIVLGNEGNGISQKIESIIGEKLFIPSFNKMNENVESLNVAMACSVICSEFRRRT